MKQTTLCYLDNGSEILLLHRVKKQNDASHDKWIGVGGKCETDESPDECMVREVKEETGFDVAEWRYRGIVTFISDVWPCEYMHLFSATRWSGEEIVCDEGDLKWVDKKHIFDYPTCAGDRIFLRLILDDAPFFSLKLIYHGDDLYAAKLNGRPIEDLQIFG